MENLIRKRIDDLTPYDLSDIEIKSLKSVPMIEQIKEMNKLLPDNCKIDTSNLQNLRNVLDQLETKEIDIIDFYASDIYMYSMGLHLFIDDNLVND